MQTTKMQFDSFLERLDYLNEYLYPQQEYVICSSLLQKVLNVLSFKIWVITQNIVDAENDEIGHFLKVSSDTCLLE